MKWYAVREGNRDDDSRSHTVSNTPGEHGWTNDSGVNGYGLTWAQAKDIEGMAQRVEGLTAELASARKRIATLQSGNWPQTPAGRMMALLDLCQPVMDERDVLVAKFRECRALLMDVLALLDRDPDAGTDTET